MARADVFAGQPRLRGAFLLGMAGLLGAFNAFTLRRTHEFYAMTVVMMFFALVLGGYLVAVGWPVDPRTQKPPRWWAYGVLTCLALGVSAGLVAVWCLRTGQLPQAIAQALHPGE